MLAVLILSKMLYSFKKSILCM